MKVRQLILPVIAALASALAVPVAASAATAHVAQSGPAVQTVRGPGGQAIPAYSQNLSSTITCATWSGTLSWGGNGSILVPAYIDLEGKLKDTCNNGYAQLFIHWDTIDNPKNELVKKVGPNSSANTPFSTEDRFNTYKDIYVYICSENSTGYRCGNHKGPGA